MTRTITTQTVLLYGNSLAISSIGASLQAYAGLNILTLDAALPDAAQEMNALRPDVILFDLAAAQPDFALALWQAQPHLLMIGVDLTSGKALVLSSQPARALTTQDLLQAIDDHCHCDLREAIPGDEETASPLKNSGSQ